MHVYKVRSIRYEGKIVLQVIGNGTEVDAERVSQSGYQHHRQLLSKTVKRYFFELGIDPEFEVSDEEESKIMLGEAIKTVVENNAEYKEVSELMSGRSGYVF